MILTKQFLNERISKRILDENIRFYQRKESDSYDVFISYSWNDRLFAYKVVELLKTCGYTAYVDYSDSQLDRRHVSEETAKRLVEKMQKCKGLLYLYSPSSSVSKWCPVRICQLSTKTKTIRIKNIWNCIHMLILRQYNKQEKTSFGFVKMITHTHL